MELPPGDSPELGVVGSLCPLCQPEKRILSKGFHQSDPFPPHIHTLSEEQGLDGAGCEALRPLAETRRQTTPLPCPGEEPALSHWSYSC